MKTVLAFDIDQTLNVAKTPIPDRIADLLIRCLDHFQICPISGQKFDQFCIQIVDRLVERGATPAQLAHLHLFVAQGTQYYRYAGPAEDQKGSAAEAAKGPATKAAQDSKVTAATNNKYSPANWQQVYNFPLSSEQVAQISQALEQAARELGYWEEDQLQPGDQIIENRLSQVTFSALGQQAGTEAKYAWDPDCQKRNRIVKRAKELAPDFDYEVGGTTSINAITPGMNKEFGMTKLLEQLQVQKRDVLYFGDMTQPGGNDYPVVQMGIDTITVRSHEDTAYALEGILGVIG